MKEIELPLFSKRNLLFLFVVLSLTYSCETKIASDQLGSDNLYAWCIVPFDKTKRNPSQRINMLKDLGLKKYAYDWRDEHLSSMHEELRLAKDAGIEIISIWMWIDDNNDTVDSLSSSNQRILSIIEEVGYEGQIWLGFHDNYFEGLLDNEAINTGVAIINSIHDKAVQLNCKVALYNHGGWFGNPLNQIKIIDALAIRDVGIIYNFHHAHDQVQNFDGLAKSMVPYLWNVNLNGMKIDGPKILTIGKGEHEKDMIQSLLQHGYKGDFGILGHVNERDVKVVLQENLDGLKSLGIGH